MTELEQMRDRCAAKAAISVAYFVDQIKRTGGNLRREMMSCRDACADLEKAIRSMPLQPEPFE